MPIIKPVSDLRNYPAVLKDVQPGQPVFLSKNGRGSYVLLDIDDYDRICPSLVVRTPEELIAALEEGERSAKEHGWIPHEEVWASLAEARASRD